MGGSGYNSGYKVLIKYIFDDDEKNLGLYFLYIVIWNVTMYNNNNNIRYREHPLNRVANMGPRPLAFRHPRRVDIRFALKTHPFVVSLLSGRYKSGWRS